MADSLLTDLTALTSPDKSDPLYINDDPSGIPLDRKITLEDLWKVINTFTAEATPVAGDYVCIYDTSANAARRVLVSNLVGVSHDHAASEVTTGTLLHERGGLELDVSAFAGLVKIDSGVTSAVTVTSAAETVLDDATTGAMLTTLGAAAVAGDTYTGSHDFGGADDLELPNSATPTVDTDGQMAIDTTVADFSAGVIKYYSTEEMAVVAMPVAELTTPTNGAVPTYNSTNDEFEMVVPSGSGDALVANPLSQFAATTSLQLLGVISDETGTGALVFATSPTLVTPALGTPASGVLTSCTGLPIAGLAAGTDGELITWDAAGVAAAVAVGTSTHVLTSNGAGAAPTFQASSGGGSLTNWTESTGTETTQYVAFLATHADTNVHAVISPKGAGSIIGQIPDGTATGGNDRGTYAVDLQTQRTVAAEVASGNWSVISGGWSNKASGHYSSVSGGANNVASGQYSFVGGGAGAGLASGTYSGIVAGVGSTASGQSSACVGGTTNTASGQSSACVGGTTNTASGTYSVLVGGDGNTASGNYSVAIGGNGTSVTTNYSTSISSANCTISGAASIALGASSSESTSNAANSIITGVDAKAERYNEHSHGVHTGTNGAAQTVSLIGSRVTVNATEVEVFLNPLTNTLRFDIPTNAVLTGVVRVSARRTDATGESDGWYGEVCIENDNGTTAILGSPFSTQHGSSSWSISIEADDTNDALIVKVTGESGKTIRWVVGFDFVQVTA